ncbi:hypothetical protein L810_5695 [Burkholderia sp. AU4i]|nr:hypothetical protein L810_5695 [Burkholderia sp. AU4i]
MAREGERLNCVMRLFSLCHADEGRRACLAQRAAAVAAGRAARDRPAPRNVVEQAI